MSRLTDLIAQVRQSNPTLAKDLEAEVKVLSSRVPFGLNFERHLPETVQLHDRTVRRGDKVMFRAPRGESDKGLDRRTWRVTGLSGTGADRTADLIEATTADAEPETATRRVDDLVVVAEFRDPIYPGLRSTGTVERGGDKPFHTVINGENYHALEALLFAYEGQVDCIYIDPPYNTRDKDWKYNNDYVDRDDAYRHSKWLAMMERRLKLANRLLNPTDSVLIVTIDENEVHRLGLLLDEIFIGIPRQLVSIVINPLGQARKHELARVEEYAFFVFLGNAQPNTVPDDLLTERSESKRATSVRWEWLIRGGTHSRRHERPNLFYPIFVDSAARRIALVGESLPATQDRHSVPVPEGLTAVWPISGAGEEGNWRCSPEYLRELTQLGYAKVGAYDRRNHRYSFLYLGKAQIQRIEEGDIAITGRDETGAVRLESLSDRKSVMAKTVWNRLDHRAGEYGSALVKRMLGGREFPFPKSLYAVTDGLRIATRNKPTSIVLDFFAGSGTTAQALMLLNSEDGGTRRSILITNNEASDAETRKLISSGFRPGDPEWERWGIAKYITKPRIRAAITGDTPDGQPIKGDYRFTDEFPMADGFEENAEFFDLTYEDPWQIANHRAFGAISPLLWLRAGAEGRRIEQVDGFDIADTYGVLVDLDQVSAFLARIDASERIRIAFIVTDDDRRFQMICAGLPERVEPVRLYESYLTNFEINTGRGEA